MASTAELLGHRCGRGSERASRDPASSIGSATRTYAEACGALRSDSPSSRSIEPQLRPDDVAVALPVREHPCLGRMLTAKPRQQGSAYRYLAGIPRELQ